MVLWQDRIKRKKTAEEGKAMIEDQATDLNTEDTAGQTEETVDEIVQDETTPSADGVEVPAEGLTSEATIEEVAVTDELDASVDDVVDAELDDAPAVDEVSSVDTVDATDEPQDEPMPTDSQIADTAGPSETETIEEPPVVTDTTETVEQPQEPIADETAPVEQVESEAPATIEQPILDAPEPAPETPGATIMAIQDRTQTFKDDFSALEKEQDDLVKEILDVMAAQKALLQSLLDALKTENEAIAAFKAAKLG